MKFYFHIIMRKTVIQITDGRMLSNEWGNDLKENRDCAKLQSNSFDIFIFCRKSNNLDERSKALSFSSIYLKVFFSEVFGMSITRLGVWLLVIGKPPFYQNTSQNCKGMVYISENKIIWMSGAKLRVSAPFRLKVFIAFRSFWNVITRLGV